MNKNKQEEKQNITFITKILNFKQNTWRKRNKQQKK